MNLDDMKTSWQDHNESLADDRFDELANDVKARTERLESGLWWRDFIETAAAALVVIAIVFFLLINGRSTPSVMMAGIIISLLAAVEIVVVMQWTRRRDSRPQPDASMKEFAEAEIARLDRQITMLQRVTWWYSLPLLSGVGVTLYGALLLAPQMPWLNWWGFVLAFAICLVWATNAIYRANKHAVQTELLPIRDQLATELKGLSDDQTNRKGGRNSC